MKKQLLLLVVMLLPMVVQGYDFQKDGIYYSIFNSENHTLDVTYVYPNEKNSDSYTGDIVVPEEVIYNDIKYTVVGIAPQAFKFCNKLTSVVLPQSIVNLGNSAFENCSSLNSINIPESVSFIGASSFSNCKNLARIDGGSGVIAIESSAFQNCSALTTINMFTSLEGIDVYAFHGCTGLTSIIIPKSVKNIKNNPFSDCPNITSIKVEDANEYYDSRNDCNAIIDKSNNTLLSGCMNTVIPEDVVKIGNDAFSGCTGLTTITIPTSIRNIGSCAFINCCGLTSITIPNSVIIIEGSVLTGCSNLSSIKVEQDNPCYDSRNDCNAIIEKRSNTLLSGCMNTIIPEGVVKIGKSAFSGICGLTSLDIPNNITTIESRAFYGCTGIPSLYISKYVSSIDETAFEGCTGISSIIVDPNNSIYDSRDNCNAIIRGDQLVLACDNTVLPLNVTRFTWYAFRNCSFVDLPDGVETMPTLMFYNCNHLKVLKIPHSVRTIEFSAIGGCNNLKTIIFEDGNEELKFQNTYVSEPYWILAASLDSVYMGRRISYEFTKSNNSQTYKQYSPFRNNESLRVVKFGSNISSIQEYYFNGCTNLTNVYLPDNLESIGYSAFYGCKNLQSIEFSSKLKTIDIDAFCECNSLKKIVIPSNVTSIGAGAFRVANLSELIIEEGEKDINLIRGSLNDYMFFGSSIDSVFWGRNGATIGYNNIKHLVIGNINNFKKVGSPSYETKGCDTIKVLSIKTSSDTLHFVVEQYSWQRKYTLPFNHIHIDSIYCDRIIDIYDPYNTGRTFYPFEGVNKCYSSRAICII